MKAGIQINPKLCCFEERRRHLVFVTRGGPRCTVEVPAGQVGLQLDRCWLVVMTGSGGRELQEGGCEPPHPSSRAEHTWDVFAAHLVFPGGIPQLCTEEAGSCLSERQVA